MISASRVGLSRSVERRCRSTPFQSGMIDSRDEAHRLDECLPGLALADEDAAALGGEAVEAAPPLAGLLDPAAAQPAALLEAVEQGVERCDVELEPPVRPRLDQLADLVAMPRT